MKLFNKNLLIPEEQNVQYLLSACLFLFMIAFGYLRATRGIDLPDEGCYLSTDMKKESLEITRNH